jgi:uncharacterized protein YbaR (Trm112 family)
MIKSSTKHLICTFCKSDSLQDEKDHLICSKCSNYFPKYNGIPVMLTNTNDFYHIRKALLPAKYRVNKYGN